MTSNLVSLESKRALTKCSALQDSNRSLGGQSVVCKMKESAIREQIKRSDRKKKNAGLSEMGEEKGGWRTRNRVWKAKSPRWDSIWPPRSACVSERVEKRQSDKWPCRCICVYASYVHVLENTPAHPQWLVLLTWSFMNTIHFRTSVSSLHLWKQEQPLCPTWLENPLNILISTIFHVFVTSVSIKGW